MPRMTQQNTTTTTRSGKLMANSLEVFAARFGDVPDHQQAAVTAYLTDVDVAALPCMFDGFSADDLADLDVARDEDRRAAVDHLVCTQLALLGRWYFALDTLDAELRDARGHHDEQTQAIVNGLSRDLFAATSMLQRAVITYHHGGAGPLLDPAYGFAYELANGTAHPFA